MSEKNEKPEEKLYDLVLVTSNGKRYLIQEKYRAEDNELPELLKRFDDALPVLCTLTTTDRAHRAIRRFEGDILTFVPSGRVAAYLRTFA